MSSSTTVRSLLGNQSERFTLTLPTGSFAFRGGLVTNNYFETLGVPWFGAGPSPTRRTGWSVGLVAVISYRVWREQFHGAEDVIGQAMVLNGHPATVIGVAAADFQGAGLTERSQVWAPLLTFTRLARREDALSPGPPGDQRDWSTGARRVACRPHGASSG